MVMVRDNVPSITPQLDDGLPPLRLLRPGSNTPAWDEGLRGEVREYAGGQRTSITRLGSYGIDLDQQIVTDAAGLQRLRAWCGKVVCYRDGLGGKVWGVVHRTPWTPSEDGTLRYVQVKLSSVTVLDEAG